MVLWRNFSADEICAVDDELPQAQGILFFKRCERAALIAYFQSATASRNFFLLASKLKVKKQLLLLFLDDSKERWRGQPQGDYRIENLAS